MRPSAADRAPGEDAEDWGGDGDLDFIYNNFISPLCSPSYFCVEVGVGSARRAGSSEI